MKVLALLALGAFIQASRAEFKEICCDEETGCFTNEHPYGHLPLPKCPDKIDPTFNLYTRDNRKNEELITRDFIPSLYSPYRRTIFLIHGYTHGRDAAWLRNSKNNLLDREDCNVIIVGWYGGSMEIWYPQAAGNTRAVASETALIAERLITNAGAHSSMFWCVGHSLGAHTCGQVGMNTHIHRVTGLDPAGPWWDGYDPMAGVNPTSGDFVDIIHSDGKALIMPFGQMHALGHMDFYPNGGHNQPGCILTKSAEELEMMGEDKDARIGETIVACSHDRACKFFIESIKNDCFLSREMCTDYNNIPKSCYDCNGGEPCAAMGYAAEDYGTGVHGLYYLKTGTGWFWQPYCKG